MHVHSAQFPRHYVDLSQSLLKEFVDRKLLSGRLVGYLVEETESHVIILFFLLFLYLLGLLLRSCSSKGGSTSSWSSCAATGGNGGNLSLALDQKFFQASSETTFSTSALSASTPASFRIFSMAAAEISPPARQQAGQQQRNAYLSLGHETFKSLVEVNQ